MQKEKRERMQTFELEEYLSGGVENIIKGILKASLDNPKESAFMVQYAAASRASRKLRQRAEAGGEHIPPFLIASITSLCNLHCKGCYARANHLCEEEITKRQMTREEWGSLFSQAEETGIGFILLAGGEPLLRRDVLEEAAVHKRILFPVFTNGTMLDASYEQLFSDHRNLVPVFSIEGERGRTDARRGDGVYKILSDSMERMKKAGILFGTSITVTKENIAEVTSCDFTEELEKAGCKAVIYVEYVPADGKTQELAPDDADRAFMDKRLAELRSRNTSMLYISFPGDEKSSGGCLAAGRGFFHINADGGAEPCPFSPYSDTHIRGKSLREVLRSPLFARLQAGGLLNAEHSGGCVLFGRESEVQALLQCE